MELRRQSLEEILDQLAPVETSWKDDKAEQILALLDSIPIAESPSRGSFVRLFDQDFEATSTLVQLILELSKDEYRVALRAKLGAGTGLGVKGYRQEPELYLEALEELGLLRKAQELLARPVTWKDLLTERLKGGRGSAIKGQRRGKALEDFTQQIVEEVFGNRYDVRCRFTGANRESTEKADFAIPNQQEPRILIEVKAYGATGSKQTDILGDMRRIVAEKRHDTHLLFVTDGMTWFDRTSDLRKLVEMQNRGMITRIYTVSMVDDLRRDLEQMRREHGLRGPESL